MAQSNNGSGSNPGNPGNLIVSNSNQNSVSLSYGVAPYGGQAGTFITSGIQAPGGLCDTVSIEGNLEVTGTGSINLEPSGGTFVNDKKTISIRGRQYDLSTLGALEAIIAALLALNDPRIDAIFDAAELRWEDADGKRIWPPSDLERLADISEDNE